MTKVDGRSCKFMDSLKISMILMINNRSEKCVALFSSWTGQKTLCIAYWFRSGVSEEGLEVPAGQQLEDDEAGMLVETDSNEMNDVGVVELAHDERLHQEVHLGLLDEQTTQLQIQREVPIMEGLRTGL